MEDRTDRKDRPHQAYTTAVAPLTAALAGQFSLTRLIVRYTAHLNARSEAERLHHIYGVAGRPRHAQSVVWEHGRERSEAHCS
ncbi:hypothetical protein E2C01_043705 [Portunus trituberculatus]|uniref:Uncharacterized protein n=1 Tax=Portunus trituberculatus TaxID=210409 RepID=A0A5B7FXF2_PORTR|nr:hypothetical protein [Portunus trituberculatus]